MSEIWSDVRYRLRALFDRDALERELDAELRFHLEREAERHERAGLSPDDARRRARAEFGRLDRVKEASRRARGTAALEAVLHDVRIATRGLRADRTFTLGVVLTFALGIGANTAMFGIVDQLLFRPPAYLRDPAAVNRVNLARDVLGGESTVGHFAYTRYLDLARSTTTAASVAAFAQRTLPVGTGERARELPVATVSASFFEFFDAPPVVGRFFTAREEVAPMGAPVVVLSYAFWQAQYGGRADVIGQPLQVGTVPSTIVGVAPPGFAGVPDDARAPLLFVPITTYAGSRTNFALGDYYTTYRWQWVGMLVRRKPGVSVDQASADLTRAFARSYDAERGLDGSLPPRRVARPRALAAPVQGERGPNASPTTTVAAWVSGVAAIVLVIVCANVANLLVTRALRRRREIALRLALGVSRRRLVGQLLTESVVLALLGGGVGIVVGHWSGLLLRGLFSLDATGTSLRDPRTLVFGGGVALAVGLATGLVPALQAGREDLAATLKAGARDGGYRRSRLRSALLVAQGALSVVLLIGAGWFVRSLQNVQALRLGYDVDPVLYVSTNMRGVQLTQAESEAMHARLLDAANATPGVETAARVTTIPFWNTWDERIVVPGIDSVERLGTFTLQASTPEYFRAMGTRVTRGRGLSIDDRAGAPPVIVVSASMAATLWPRAEAIGRCVRVGADTAPCRTVVGIVEDAKQTSLAGPREMQYYLALAQFHDADGKDMVVRVRGSAGSLAETVRRRLQRLMPGAAYVTATPMRAIVAEQTQSWRLGATMFLALGALALVLAAVGLYSVLAYTVAQRARELAVRVALGAQRGDVLRLVVGEGARFAVAGIAIGAALALVAGRWTRALLFDVSPSDPAVLGTVVVVLLLVALAASLVPAWRATHADPNVILRAD